MSIKFKCPDCGQSVKVSLAHAGKRGKCPGCAKVLQMPSAEKLKALEARAASKSASLSGVGVGGPPSPAPSEPPTDDPLGDLSGTSWDDDDFSFPDPEPPAEETANPYASPMADIGPQASIASSGAEATRKRLLSHEASIKSLGLLYIIGAVLGGLAGVAYVVLGMIALVSGGEAAAAGGLLLGLGVVVSAFAAFQYWLGSGLRKCNPSVRIPVIVLSAIGLLGFPIGTLISAYFLYLLCSKKGAEVMSKEYQRVIAATPHIKYRTSIIVWILVALLIGLVLFGVFAAMGG